MVEKPIGYISTNKTGDNRSWAPTETLWAWKTKFCFVSVMYWYHTLWWGEDSAHFQILAYFLVALSLITPQLRGLTFLQNTPILSSPPLWNFLELPKAKIKDSHIESLVFSPQVIEKVIKKKLRNISGIPKCTENTITRIDYLPSTLGNKTLQIQAKLPKYSFCLLRGNHYFHTWFIFCYICIHPQTICNGMLRVLNFYIDGLLFLTLFLG